YITSNTLTTIALILYVPTTIAYYFNIWKRGAKFMLCIAIGATFYCIGIALRYILHSHPESKGVFIGMYLLTLLSPCAFIAGIYMILGRVAGALQMGQYLIVKPERLTRYFVFSDVGTFLLQALGGSMMTSQTLSTVNLGRTIFLIGMALQVISFAFFTLVLLLWSFKVQRYAPHVWNRDKIAGKPWLKDWRWLDASIILSCVGVLIRSFFRAAENIQGGHGALSTTEVDFYVLDSLPLFIAISVYVVFWPGRFISALEKEDHASHELKAPGHPSRYDGAAN
ncbi:hypothetical protein FRB97_005674, partial [Tulasnella sp. 331]